MLDAQSCSFVVVGQFNPAIVTPAWLGFNNIIQRGEAETANINMVSEQVSSYTVEWLKVQITQDRFSIETGEPTKFMPLRDVFLQIFQLLSQTPVSAMGLNFSYLIDTNSEDDWHKIGHQLAPKQFWSEYLQDPGMVEVTIAGGNEEIKDDRIRVSVRPVGPKRVRVDFNHHFSPVDVEEGDFRQKHRLNSQFVESNWKDIIQFNEKLTLGVQSLINA
jgi:hypothetical protein